MSNEATAMIAVKDKDDGGYRCISVERGGEKLGEWLKRYFSNHTKAKALVELGNLEAIDVRRVIAQHRDNRASFYDNRPIKAPNARILFRLARFNMSAEFTYVWMPNSRGTWRWRTFDCREYYLYTEPEDPDELTDKDGR